MPRVCESIEIDAPPQVVFDVVADYERYPEFVRGYRDVSVDHREGDQVEATFTVDVPRHMEFTLHLVERRPATIRWRLGRSDVLDEYNGSWTLEALDGDRTRATYEVDFEVPDWVPDGTERALAEDFVPRMLQWFKWRSETWGKVLGA